MLQFVGQLCRSRLLGPLIFACLLFQPLAQAQDNIDNLDSTVTYPAAFFAPYEPVSARDMLNRIPGINVALGSNNDSNNENRRGLGAGDNQILIDGKRIAGKENDGRETLGRISAKQVEYIEIIRGTSADLDVRSAGPIVNVVLKEGAGRSSLSAEVNADWLQINDKLRPGGSLSFGDQRGDLNYLASIEVEPRYQFENRREGSFLGDGPRNDIRREEIIRDQTNYKISANAGYQLSERDSIQFNAFYEDSSAPREVERIITDFQNLDANGNVTERIQTEDRDADKDKWEFGGTYEHNFTNAGKLKIIGIINDETDDNVFERIGTLADPNQRELFIDEQKRTQENIVRASYSFGLTEGQDVETGVEYAKTTLDSFFFLNDALDSDTTIEEVRYEPFVIHNWQINPKMALESTLVWEFSEITQDGIVGAAAVDRVRDFDFLRPKLDYRYDITSSFQFRASVERDIAQLDFSDFSSSSNGDVGQNSNTGNPNIVQEKAIKYEVNLEYRFPNDAGVLSGRLFYDDVEDVINKEVSVVSNIGDGERYGLELNASVRLGFIDMPDFLVTSRLLVRDSEVVDPFIGIERRFNRDSRGDYRIDFRHDLPQWNLNYGAAYTYFFRGNNLRVDIDDTAEFERDPEMSVFVEKVAFGGLTFRLESMNFLDGNRCLKRTRFQDNLITTGVVSEIERSCVGPGRKIALKIRGTF